MARPFPVRCGELTVAPARACGSSRPAYIAGGGNKGLLLLKNTAVEPRSYRDAMARFAGAVHVIATAGEAGRRGVTVIAACSVSDNPPTILVCLNRENVSNDLFRDNGVFTLNTLTDSQEPLADAFSGLTGLSQDDRFAAAEWDTIATGAPSLVGAAAVFDCELVDAKDLATHRVLFGRVRGVRIGDSLNPLIYYNRAYRVL
jgi:cob(II)yrinic acid a,c-diamide reductase